MNLDRTLTADDVAQLRLIGKNKSHAVRFTLVADYRQGHGWGLTMIETHQHPEGFEPRTTDRRYRIMVNGQNNIYRDMDGARRLVCSVDTSYDTCPIALSNLVKAGDKLVLIFRIGNDTDRMKEAGLTHDECDLIVVRNDKTIAVMRFDDLIGPANGWTMVDGNYKPERDGNVA